MKAAAIALALVALSASAFAQDEMGQNQAATSAAVNAGNSQGMSLTIQAAQPLPKTELDQRIEYGAATIRNTPSVSGPPLVSSNDTCMGSASGSLNGPGVGLSFGRTYRDDNCVMLKNGRELWNMGLHKAAIALYCKSSDMREALETSGVECPPAKVTTTTERVLP